MINETNHILIVDDHVMVRDGLSMMLKSQTGEFNFSIQEAGSGEEALDILKNKKFDIIIMDYQLPRMTGAEATKEILTRYPKNRVLALSNSDEMMNITHMINCGAKGYILKNISPVELVKAINTVLLDQQYYSNEIALKLIANNNEKSDIPVKKIRKLSYREVEVLRHLVNQKSHTEIADLLGIKKRTVEEHVHNMLGKFNLKNSTSLIIYALKNHLLAN
jgi:DNA-binding NarL/FixJ family response regulator